VLFWASLLTGQQASETFDTIDAEQFFGRLEALVDGTNLRIDQGGEKRLLPIDQLSSWHRPVIEGTSAQDAAASGMLHMRSGMALACSFIDADGMQVRLLIPPSLAPVSLSLRHLFSLRVMQEAEEDGGFARALERPPSTNDYLFAVNRDSGKINRLSVTVQGFVDGNLQVLFHEELRPVPIDRIYGLVLGRDLGSPPEPLARPTVTLSFDDGQSAHGRLSRWDGKHCSLTLADGATLQLPCSSVLRFTVQSSKVLFLSDLDPSVEQVPAFDRIRPWLRDSSPAGKGLELHGKTYARGLCLIPHTKLTFDLDGSFDFFAAVVGIDDRSSREANADFRVYADSEVVFEATTVRQGQASRFLRIPLAGHKHLTLEADFGANFDFGDHCLFANARLLKN